MRRRAPIPARLFWLLCLCLLAAAVVVTVQQTVAPEEADTAPPPPLCSDVDMPDPVQERVTCRTATATLTIAGEGHPVVLPRTEARVLGSELERRILTIRVRLRRDTGTFNRRGAVRRQLYVRVGDQRIWPLPGPRPEGTMRLRFALPKATARALRRGKASAELGIVAWDELGEERPGRVGVVRLDPRG